MCCTGWKRPKYQSHLVTDSFSSLKSLSSLKQNHLRVEMGGLQSLCQKIRSGLLFWPSFCHLLTCQAAKGCEEPQLIGIQSSTHSYGWRSPACLLRNSQDLCTVSRKPFLEIKAMVPFQSQQAVRGDFFFSSAMKYCYPQNTATIYCVLQEVIWLTKAYSKIPVLKNRAHELQSPK